MVDASVLPRTTNANLNAAVMLVAEKASQDILKCYANLKFEVSKFIS